MIYAGAAIGFLGLLMTTRGWIYTLRPNGKMAERRKRRNLRLGFTTDMAVFGKKVRRIGLMILLVGGGLIAWHMTLSADTTSPSAQPAAAAPVRTTPFDSHPAPASPSASTAQQHP